MKQFIRKYDIKKKQEWIKTPPGEPVSDTPFVKKNPMLLANT